MKTSPAVAPLLSAGLVFALALLSGCTATPVAPASSSAAPSPSATAGSTAAPYDLGALTSLTWESDAPQLSTLSQRTADELLARPLTTSAFETCTVDASGAPVYAKADVTVSPIGKLDALNFLRESTVVVALPDDDATDALARVTVPAKTGKWAGDLSAAAIPQAVGYVPQESLKCVPATHMFVVDVASSTAQILDARGSVVASAEVRRGSDSEPTPITITGVQASYQDPTEPYTTGVFPLKLLSAFSPGASVQDYNGGRGNSSIHYWGGEAWDTPTAGCVGVQDEAFMQTVTDLITAGTPVVIR